MNGQPWSQETPHVPYSNREGHVEDVVEGRPVLLAGEPAVFHVEALEDGGVEELTGASLALR
jgi:hypothetical protein